MFLFTQVNPQFYAFRWITLLLTQEFDFADSLRLWDSLLANPEGPLVSNEFLKIIGSFKIQDTLPNFITEFSKHPALSSSPLEKHCGKVFQLFEIPENFSVLFFSLQIRSLGSTDVFHDFCYTRIVRALLCIFCRLHFRVLLAQISLSLLHAILSHVLIENTLLLVSQVIFDCEVYNKISLSLSLSLSPPPSMSQDSLLLYFRVLRLFSSHPLSL